MITSVSGVGIVATIGPVSATYEALIKLKAAGMTVARLNGSHNTLDWHADTIKLIRTAVPDVPILLDIPGRKIRTGQLAAEPTFKAGDHLILTTDTSQDGTEKVPVNFEKLHEQLQPGVKLYADDGTLSFTVTTIIGRDIHVIATGDGTLRSRKGINVPGVILGRDLVTDHDRHMVQFAKSNEVDYVGISFVESATHVGAVRELINGRTPRVVAKIENQGGLDHLEEVVGAADVIMIDRGDLSVETDMDQVSIYQKRIIQSGRKFGKPVIVATELLHTMIENPYPTRAEIGDVTNAVIDGASLLMLSGETAIGRYPVEAVTRLKGISRAAQSHVLSIVPGLEPANDIARAVRALAMTLPVSHVVVLSRSGYAAGLVSAALIKQPITAVHSDMAFARSLNLIPNVQGVWIPELLWDDASSPIHTLAELKTLGTLAEDDIVLVVSANVGDERRYFNSFQTIRVGSSFDQPTSLNKKWFAMT